MIKELNSPKIPKNPRNFLKNPKFPRKITVKTWKFTGSPDGGLGFADKGVFWLHHLHTSAYNPTSFLEVIHSNNS